MEEAMPPPPPQISAEQVYREYHRQVQRCIAEAQARHEETNCGTPILIDIHAHGRKENAHTIFVGMQDGKTLVTSADASTIVSRLLAPLFEGSFPAGAFIFWVGVLFRRVDLNFL